MTGRNLVDTSHRGARTNATPTFVLETMGPDGRPHSGGVGAVWKDGEVYVAPAPRTRLARNLAVNPACTVSVSLPGLDLILTGDATRVRDTETLEWVAAVHRQGRWPSPGPDSTVGAPPWNLYRLTVHTAVGAAGAGASGATRLKVAG